MIETEILYKYNDELLFAIKRPAWEVSFEDDNREVIFVCPKHKIRMTRADIKSRGFSGLKLICPLCKREDDYSPLNFYSQTYESLQEEALSLLDKDEFKNAKLIRLDDIYTPEIMGFDALKNKDSSYSIKVDIKEDKDGDTIVILYIGYKGEKDKSQIFIKPEKLQLSHDFKDMDPAQILAKIELTLKDRTIFQNYDVEKK